jgi:hypothetical protein
MLRLGSSTAWMVYSDTGNALDHNLRPIKRSTLELIKRPRKDDAEERTA